MHLDFTDFPSTNGDWIFLTVLAMLVLLALAAFFWPRREESQRSGYRESEEEASFSAALARFYRIFARRPAPGAVVGSAPAVLSEGFAKVARETSEQIAAMREPAPPPLPSDVEDESAPPPTVKEELHVRLTETTQPTAVAMAADPAAKPKRKPRQASPKKAAKAKDTSAKPKRKAAKKPRTGFAARAPHSAHR